MELEGRGILDKFLFVLKWLAFYLDLNEIMLAIFQAISCHYAASECHYLDIDETSSQANIANEVREQTERVLGKELAANLTFAVSGSTMSGTL